VEEKTSLMNRKLERVTRRVRTSPFDLVRYQVIAELAFYRREHMIPSDIELLTWLALWGPLERRAFCARAARSVYPEAGAGQLPTREQNVRNRVVKLEKRGLVVRPPGQGRMIAVNPALGIRSGGDILLEHQLLSLHEAG
jgi:hypothetical protein